MAGRGVEYPSVFVVDSRAGIPPLPPKPGRMLAQTQRRRVIQTMLFLLVSMALFGVVVEACFIYYLYNNQPNSNHSSFSQKTPETSGTEARKGGKPMAVSTPPPNRRDSLFPKPTKPIAHLAAGSGRPEANGIMPWANVDEGPHGLEYEEGKLIVQISGHYYIYSKLCFTADENQFEYFVMRRTPLYTGDEPIKLLRYRYNGTPRKSYHMSALMRDSYMGGLFELVRGDAVFVWVRNGTVRLQTTADNFFGMFMV